MQFKDTNDIILFVIGSLLYIYTNFKLLINFYNFRCKKADRPRLDMLWLHSLSQSVSYSRIEVDDFVNSYFDKYSELQRHSRRSLILGTY